MTKRMHIDNANIIDLVRLDPSTPAIIHKVSGLRYNLRSSRGLVQNSLKPQSLSKAAFKKFKNDLIFQNQVNTYLNLVDDEFACDTIDDDTNKDVTLTSVTITPSNNENMNSSLGRSGVHGSFLDKTFNFSAQRTQATLSMLNETITSLISGFDNDYSQANPDVESLKYLLLDSSQLKVSNLLNQVKPELLGKAIHLLTKWALDFLHSAKNDTSQCAGNVQELNKMLSLNKGFQMVDLIQCINFLSFCANRYIFWIRTLSIVENDSEYKNAEDEQATANTFKVLVDNLITGMTLLLTQKANIPLQCIRQVITVNQNCLSNPCTGAKCRSTALQSICNMIAIFPRGRSFIKERLTNIIELIDFNDLFKHWTITKNLLHNTTTVLSPLSSFFILYTQHFAYSDPNGKTLTSKSIKQFYDGTIESCKHMFGVIFNRFASKKKETSLYSSHVCLLETLVKELNVCLFMPEYFVVMVMLPFFTAALVNLVMDRQISSSSKTTFLEMIFQLTSVSLKIQSKHKDIQQNDEANLNDMERNSYIYVYRYLYPYRNTDMIYMTASNLVIGHFIEFNNYMPEDDAMKMIMSSTDESIPVSYDEASFHMAKILFYSNSSQNSPNALIKKIAQLFQMESQPALVRSKAIKCMAMLAEIDPAILYKDNVLICVNNCLNDKNISIREASVTMISYSINKNLELAEKYYKILCDRIWDTGISVRLRAVQALSSLIIEFPHSKISNYIAIQLLKRISDDAQVQKHLISSLDSYMFSDFTKDSIFFAIALDRSSLSHLNTLFSKQLRSFDDFYKIARILLDFVVSAELNGNQMVLGVLEILSIFLKYHPTLLIDQIYLLCVWFNSFEENFNYSGLEMNQLLYLISQTLKHIYAPSKDLLCDLEIMIIKTLMTRTGLILRGCISCLWTIVSFKSHNYNLVKDLISKFTEYITKCRQERNKSSVIPHHIILRSLLCLGLFYKEIGLHDKIQINAEEIYDHAVFYYHNGVEFIQEAAIETIGIISCRNNFLLLRNNSRHIFNCIFKNGSHRKILQVLKAFEDVILGEKQNSLNSISNEDTGMHSTIAQVYLPMVLSEIDHFSNYYIRVSSLQLISHFAISRLIHPAKCVPFIIALSTDEDNNIRSLAETTIQKLSQNFLSLFKGCILEGINLSYLLRNLIYYDKENSILRGFFKDINSHRSVLHFIYNLISSDHRKKNSMLDEMMPDNIAYFPYKTSKELRSILSLIDVTTSAVGFTALRYLNDLKQQMQQGSSIEYSLLTSVIFAPLILNELKSYLSEMYGIKHNDNESGEDNDTNRIIYANVVVRQRIFAISVVNKYFTKAFQHTLTSTSAIDTELLKLNSILDEEEYSEEGYEQCSKKTDNTHLSSDEV
ncbi:hypothetical protein GJ496_005164 [Pomphorhynchus laevis]|nr:hypothetical protein GJ496_005164 [Pomphorhynchus laevis]